MSQLKQDEWPADNEPTTTESQTSTASTGERAHRANRSPAPRDVTGREPSAETDEVASVTPDRQID